MSIVELKKSAASRNLGRGIYILLELSHSKFDQTYRMIDNTESVTFGADTFEPFPFKFVPSTQGETSGASVALSNIDREISRQIKNATDNENITCKVWVCQIENNGQLNAQRTDNGEFEVESVLVNKDAVTLSLNMRISINYNASSQRFSPSVFRNLYL